MMQWSSESRYQATKIKLAMTPHQSPKQICRGLKDEQALQGALQVQLVAQKHWRHLLVSQARPACCALCF